MRRREFVGGLAGEAAWPLAARGQQPNRVARVGVLMNSAATDTGYQAYLAARDCASWDGPNAKISVPTFPA